MTEQLASRLLMLAGIGAIACAGEPTSVTEERESEREVPDPAPCTVEVCQGAAVEALGLDSFYEKYLDANGIPVVSSGKVSDEALFNARDVVMGMVTGVVMGMVTSEDVRRAMIGNGALVGVIAVSEETTDMPEYRFLKDDPSWNWDVYRGLGGSPEIPLSSAGEENLLCLEDDRYRGENILVHEFAHGMHLQAIMFLDSTFNRQLLTAYSDAKARGVWVDYPTENEAVQHWLEYWAEGVQSWVHANKNGSYGLGEMDTRAELVTHHPALANLIARFLGRTSWQPSCPGG